MEPSIEVLKPIDRGSKELPAPPPMPVRIQRLAEVKLSDPLRVIQAARKVHRFE